MYQGKAFLLPLRKFLNIHLFAYMFIFECASVLSQRTPCEGQSWLFPSTVRALELISIMIASKHTAHPFLGCVCVEGLSII